MLRQWWPLLVCWLYAPCRAQEITLYMMEVPPLTTALKDRHGVVGDIVLEAMRRAGFTPHIVSMPNNRALAVVGSAESADTLIIPLARVPEREERYTWIAPIVRVNRTFFSLQRQVNSFAEARSAFTTIGVSRGTAGVSILRAAGIPDNQIYELNQGETGLRMLLAGRIDAWYGPIAEGRALRNSLDAEDRILVGAPLGASYNYLGCSKRCQRKLVDRLSEALATMDKDGSTRRIMRQYGALD